MNELEQKAREIADRRIPPDKIIDGDRVWGGHNGQAEKWLHAKEAALEALQLKQAEIAQIHKDYGCEIRDPNGTIWEYAASLRERCERLEGALHSIALNKRNHMVIFDGGMAPTDVAESLESLARAVRKDLAAGKLTD